jgi:hypothetical protein
MFNQSYLNEEEERKEKQNVTRLRITLLLTNTR